MDLYYPLRSQVKDHYPSVHWSKACLSGTIVKYAERWKLVRPAVLHGLLDRFVMLWRVVLVEHGEAAQYALLRPLGVFVRVGQQLFETPRVAGASGNQRN